MKHASAAAFGILLSLATSPANADVITDWNQTAIAVLKNANVGGNPWTRSMAMVHVAMSDAVNSVQGRFARYVAKGELARDASAEAAAASAARQILIQLYPAQKAAIEEAFSSSTKSIPDGTAKTSGIALAGDMDTHDTSAVRPVRAGKALGAQERGSVPSRSAAAIDERGLCPRLQRDEEPGRRPKHSTNS
jgi:hypothetical protein